MLVVYDLFLMGQGYLSLMLKCSTTESSSHMKRENFMDRFVARIPGSRETWSMLRFEPMTFRYFQPPSDATRDRVLSKPGGGGGGQVIRVRPKLNE